MICSPMLNTGSNAVIYVGYTADRGISRGEYRSDTSRVWAINLVDINTVIDRRVMTGSDANRPAETLAAAIRSVHAGGRAPALQVLVEVGRGAVVVCPVTSREEGYGLACTDRLGFVWSFAASRGRLWSAPRAGVAQLVEHKLPKRS